MTKKGARRLYLQWGQTAPLPPRPTPTRAGVGGSSPSPQHRDAAQARPAPFPAPKALEDSLSSFYKLGNRNSERPSPRSQNYFGAMPPWMLGGSGGPRGAPAERGHLFRAVPFLQNDSPSPRSASPRPIYRRRLRLTVITSPAPPGNRAGIFRYRSPPLRNEQ